jgi:hypothetical protein
MYSEYQVDRILELDAALDDTIEFMAGVQGHAVKAAKKAVKSKAWYRRAGKATKEHGQKHWKKYAAGSGGAASLGAAHRVGRVRGRGDE